MEANVDNGKVVNSKQKGSRQDSIEIKILHIQFYTMAIFYNVLLTIITRTVKQTITNSEMLTELII